MFERDFMIECDYRETVAYCNKMLHDTIGHILFEMDTNKRLTSIPWIKEYLLDLACDIDFKIK